MSDSEEAESDAPRIRTKSVEDLVRVVKQCKGEYAFLVGAGTSKPAGIPTSGELIEEWREEVYEDRSPDEDFEDWVDSIEEEQMPDGWSRYGFWFEKAYPAKASRREYIRDLVEEETPSFGIIILASMMAEGYVPLALTPNFDDLLYDAFYLFLEDKPMLVDHDAIAPQLKLTDDRPTIVKLHGDYLYDNLKNTADETGELEENMQDAMKQALGEYGLVVVGYSGDDESIMSVLQKEPISDYELFWCGRDGVEDVKGAWGDDAVGLSEQVESVLNESEDASYVPIEGAEELFGEFWLGFDGFSPPQPEEIRKRADERAGRLKKAMDERQAKATGEEEELLKLWDTLEQAGEYIGNGKFGEAEEVYQQFLQQNQEELEHTSDFAVVHEHYGNFLRNQLDRPNEAEEQYNKAIEVDPEYLFGHLYYGYLLSVDFNRHVEATDQFRRATEVSPSDPLAHNALGQLLKDEFDSPLESEKHFTRALEIDPNLPVAHKNYAELLRDELNRPDEAQHHFELAADLDPRYAEGNENGDNEQ